VGPSDRAPARDRSRRIRRSTDFNQVFLNKFYFRTLEMHYTRLDTDSAPEVDVEDARTPLNRNLDASLRQTLNNDVFEAAMQEKNGRQQERTYVARRKPGIPAPRHPRFQPFLVCRWMVMVAATLGSCWLILDYSTGQKVYKLDAGSSLTLDLENCDFKTRELSEKEPYDATVSLQHFRFVGHGSFDRNNDDEATVSMRMRIKLAVFRCLVTLATKPGKELASISGRIGGSELSTVQWKVAAAKSVSVRLRQVYFKAEALPEKLDLKATNGMVEIRPLKPQASQVSVECKESALVARSSGPLTVNLHDSAKGSSILSAPNIKEASAKGDSKTYHLEAASEDDADKRLVIDFSTSTQSPGYFLGGTENDFEASDDDDGGLKTVKGDLQSRGKPWMTNYSKAEIKHAAEWVEEMSGTSAPWVFRVRLKGPGLPQGTWQVLSSQAFLAFPLEAFVVLSAGSLSPMVKEVIVQSLSMPNQWPEHNHLEIGKHLTEAHADEFQEDSDDDGDCRVYHSMQWDSFYMLKPYIANGNTVAWIPDEGPQIIYQKRGDVWLAKKRDLLKNQSLMFIIAVLLNFGSSAVMATIVIVYGRKQMRKITRFREDAVSVAASHRVSGQNQSTQAWNVLATQVDWPDHAVLLRWRKRIGAQRASYFMVYAEANDDPDTGSSYHAVTIEKIAAEKIESQTQNTMITELLFSISGRDLHFGYPQIKPLRYQHCYQFQVVAYNQGDQIVAMSEWSNMQVVMPKKGIFDMPLLLIKTFFPVPTSSLRYFVDHHADRHIEGQIPQHVVVLSDIQIFYHKNFFDFKDCGDPFYVTAYMGDNMTDCMAQTRRGRCTTFGQTASFKAPELCTQEIVAEEDKWMDTEDEVLAKKKKNPKHRMTALDTVCGNPQVFRLGTIDRAKQDLIISIRWEENDEDAAEAKVDFVDLMEAFEEERDDDVDIQTYFCDLKPERKEDFDEDYLVWIRVKVNFENSIVRCDPLLRNLRLFLKDCPGQIFYEGMERTLVWAESDALLAEVDQFDLFVSYPDLPHIQPTLLHAGVMKSSVGVTFMVNFPPEHRGCYVTAQVDVRVTDTSKTSNPYIDRGEVISHRFMVCRTWTKSDFEMAYASFCKMNGMTMEHLSSQALEELGLSTTQAQLKVVPDLRPPLPFEQLDVGEVINSPGMITIGAETVHVKVNNGGYDDNELDPQTSESGVRQSTSGAGTAMKTASAPSEGSKEIGSKITTVQGSTADMQQNVFRSTSRLVPMMEHIWSRSQPMCTLQHGRGWECSILLVYGFYPVDNILTAMDEFVDILGLRFIFFTLQSVAGSRFADTIHELSIAPITWLLPFICEALLLCYQLIVFLFFPASLLMFCLIFEILKDQFGEPLHAMNEDSSHLPDLLFSESVSGRDMKTWLADLSLESSISLCFSVVTFALQLALLFESNFLRSRWHWSIQGFAHYFLNNLADAIITFYVWSTLFFISTVGLWFIMAVVIYPEQMLTALGCVAGVIFFFTAMMQSNSRTRAQIMTFLRHEVPEVLDLVCDNVLEDYDRVKAGANQYREITRDKLESDVWEKIGSYYKRRLHVAHGDRGDRFEAVFTLPEDSMESAAVSSLQVHRTFARALLKEKYWEGLSDYEHAFIEQSTELPTQELRASYESTLDALKYRTTKKSLHDLGLQHDDTVLPYFDLRVRVTDRETEVGGEAVHRYDKDLRQKLMKVYVRLLEEFESPPQDVAEVLKDSRKLSQAIARSHESKTKLFDPSQAQSDESEGKKKTLLELFVQDVHQQKLKDMYFFMAEHLDTLLDPQKIADIITPFVDKRMPDEIDRRLRLTLDEHYVGSSMQRLFETLRRLKGQTKDEEMEEKLTLTRQGKDGQTTGLLKLLEEIGLLSPKASNHYKENLTRKLDRMVRQWNRDDSSELTLDSADLEAFVRELVDGKIWWGALADMLQKIGFPIAMSEDQKMFGTAIRTCSQGQDLPATELSELEVMAEFESKASTNGLMPVDSLLDFLREVTRADQADGCAGRVWKSQMRLLMRALGIGGYLDMDIVPNAENPVNESSSPRAKDDDKKKKTEKFKLAANSQWPSWLDDIWNESVDEWEPNQNSSRLGGGKTAKAFLPKPKIQRFLQRVMFVEHKTQSDENEVFKEVHEDYDNFLKCTQEGEETTLWLKRSRTYFKIRGCWHELFLALLDKMDNGVQEKKNGLALFNKALADSPSSHGGTQAGLLGFDYLENTWLKTNMIQRTSECSLAVFKEVLVKAEITIPEIVVEQLWWNSDKEKCLHPSLRHISDLEDRVVMYLSRGLCYESARSLVQDELVVPTLQVKSDAEVKAAFEQVDDKTGKVGFIEPREVNEILLLLSLQGMSLAGIQSSFKRLNISFAEDEVKGAFLMMDTNADDVIDMSEFLGMIDYLIDVIIPKEVFSSLQLTAKQVAVKVSAAAITAIAILMFVFISLGAFQVDVSKGATSQSSSLIRAGLALVAAMGLRKDSAFGGDDDDLRFAAARDFLYLKLGVTQSQLETKRRSGNPKDERMPGKPIVPNIKAKMHMGGKRHAGKMDDDDDDRDDDDGGD